MATGIFAVMNHQGSDESAITLAKSFFDGLFLMSIAGVRTNAELKSIIEAAIERPLVAEETSDLLAISTYIAAGSGESGKMARLHRISAVAGIWETGQGGITEAEARTMTGVDFS